MSNNTITLAEALVIADLVNYTEQGISSRVLAKNGGGNITLFAFDKGQALSEHSAPFDAIVMIAEGSLILTIAGKPVTAKPGILSVCRPIFPMLWTRRSGQKCCW